MRELKLIGGICLFLFLMVLAIPLWILSSNKANKLVAIKVSEQIVSREGQTTDYNYSTNEEAGERKLTPIEKSHLINFISINLELIAGKTSPEEMHATNKHIELEWNIPKIALAQIKDGTLRYTFISKAATQSENGIYNRYSSIFTRNNDRSGWRNSDLFLCRPDINPILSDFDEGDFSRLGLTLVKVTFAKNFTTEAGDLKPLEKLGPVAFKQGKGNYAFYEFQSNTQPHPLTVTFVVQQKQYNETASLPRNWHYIHIQRTASQS